MTPEELRDALEKADVVCHKIGLGRSDGLTLTMETDRAPSGYKVRTPFGNCEIMNCQERNGKFTTVFRVKREQIVTYLKKCGLVVMTGRV